MFPSPLGVIFSLICGIHELYIIFETIVSVSSRSYILSYIQCLLWWNARRRCIWVSVSSRSYILSYLLSLNALINTYFSVSVSSRSYILSYDSINLEPPTKKYWLVSVSSRSYILSYYEQKRNFNHFKKH